MKRRVIRNALLFVAVAGVTAAISLSQFRKREAVVVPADVRKDLSAPVAPSRATSGPIDSSDERPTKEAQSDEDLSPPSPGQIENEIESDPHGTPRSVLRFAHQLAGPMEAALQSQAAALKLFPKLAECAKNGASEGSLVPVRALCLANATELAGRYPSDLKQAHERLLSEVPEAVVKLAASLN